MDVIWILLASMAGAGISLQAAANSSLRANVGDARYAAFLSICGTFVVALLAMLLIRPGIPSLAVHRATPWWNWIGGPLGATFVLAGAALTSRLGTAAFIAAVVGGQLICSLVLDSFGLMNVPLQPLSIGKVAGAAMVFGGVLLVRYG
jgi:bacterial/archaeal transporter family-2 protein